MARVPRILLGSIALLLAGGGAARADSVAITSGFFELEPLPAGALPPFVYGFRLSLAGDDFALAHANVLDRAPEVLPCVSSACVAGRPVSLSTTVNFGATSNLPTLSTDPAGDITAQIDGITQEHVLLSTLATGQPFTFRADGLDARAGALSAPFEFSGGLRVFTLDGELHDVQFSGAGTATLRLSADGDRLAFDAIRFDFGPPSIPEPTTLTLLGSGGLTMLIARRRRCRGSPERASGRRGRRARS